MSSTQLGTLVVPILDKCSIGEILNDECHGALFCKTTGLIKISSFSEEDKRLVLWRINSTSIGVITDTSTICYHHEKVFLTRFENLQKFCCDPFKRHKKHVTKGLRTIKIEFASSLKSKLPSTGIIPGQKLCAHCQQECQRIVENETDSADSDFVPSEDKKVKLNETLIHLGESPIKKISRRDKTSYIKAKVAKVNKTMLEIMGEECSSIGESSKKECRECTSFDKIIDALKEKVNLPKSTCQEKINLLTLVPDSYTKKEIMEQFKVSNYVVRQARKLKKQKGILPGCNVKPGKIISESLKNKVASFYENDEFSRICPGKKECVSVKKDGSTQLVQKRLLLINLSELHTEFLKTTQEKVGFSKFCELRPKNCILVGKKGTHSVCVCEYHQNAKLILFSFPGKVNYKEMLSNLVCDLENRECMLHQCAECPGIKGLDGYINEVLIENHIESNDTIEFKQWVHTQQTSLEKMQLPAVEYTEKLISILKTLAPHHYIAKEQAKFLRRKKETLAETEAIVLLDFAENYSFIVQDAVQGHHWTNSQATLHPFVMYYRNQVTGNLEHYNYCVISNYLNHDSNTVHTFISKMVSQIKTKFKDIKKILYFSDGAASQYKNFKNLVNLCYHETDFNIEAEWNFFATSHGKSPCDGIGGTVKRLVARASLQATKDKQIQSAEEMFSWANKNIQNIQFDYISKDDVLNHVQMLGLGERYARVKTIPGTRSHHSYIPISKNSLKMKRISVDEIFSTITLFSTPSTANIRVWEDCNPGQFIACTYDNEWYIGNILQRSEEDQDVEVSFMKRKELALQWPINEDICWIPFQNILYTIEPDISASGRKYSIKKQDFDTIVSIFANII